MQEKNYSLYGTTSVEKEKLFTSRYSILVNLLLNNGFNYNKLMTAELFNQSQITPLTATFGLPILKDGACHGLCQMDSNYTYQSLDTIQSIRDNFINDAKAFINELLILHTQQSSVNAIRISKDNLLVLNKDFRYSIPHPLLGEKVLGLAYHCNEISSHISTITINNNNDYDFFDCNYFKIKNLNNSELQTLLVCIEIYQKQYLGYSMNNYTLQAMRPININYLCSCAFNLVYVAKDDRMEILKYLVEQKNVHPNTMNSYGNTPIYYASANNELEALDYLVNNGGDIEQMVDGSSPLHVAVHNSHAQSVQYLLTAGANTNVINSCGHTPLHIAVSKDQLSISQNLIMHKANVNIATYDNNGYSALHIAINQGNLDITCLLLSCEIDKNACDWNGSSPLHLAANNGNVKIVELLLMQKVTFNIKNLQKQTASDLARANGHNQVAELIEQHMDKEMFFNLLNHPRFTVKRKREDDGESKEIIKKVRTSFTAKLNVTQSLSFNFS